MNQNKIICTFIDNLVGHQLPGVAYAKIAEALNSQSVILIRAGAKYGSKIINYTANNYVQPDFKIETLFLDATDASFFAD